MRISDWSSDVCSSDLGWHGLLSPRCSLPTEKAGVKAPAFFAGPVYRAIPTSDCCGHARGKGFTSAPQPGTTHHPLLHIIALGGKSCCNAAKQEAQGGGSRLSLKASRGRERKRVGGGKRGPGRVDNGGGRVIKK